MKFKTFFIIGISIAVIIGIIGLLSLISNFVMKSDAVVLVVKTLEKDKEVTDITGSPVELKLLGGSIRIQSNDSTGFAKLDTSLYGPKGRVKFVANVKKSNGKWDITYLAVYPNGVQVIKIEDKVE